MKKNGRPTGYKFKYCRQIISWMAKGYSMASFAGKIGCGERTIYDWAGKNEEFSQSIKIGKAKSILFWEQVGLLGMMGKIPKFNSTAWIFQMKNRWGWADKLTVDIEDSAFEKKYEEMKDETSIETLQRLIAKYGRQLPPIN